MKIFRPLQLGYNHRVLEHDRKYYFVASATLGMHLRTGESLLEFDYLKDAFPSMGVPSLPDMGMPKPRGEFLVSGSFFAPNGQPVMQGGVAVRLGHREKALAVFGPRQWRMGTIAKAEAITTIPLDFAHAFGGSEYKANPFGMGYKDGLLPCVEDPARLILSSGDRPTPAGLGPLDPSWPQRMRFSGTYNRKYLKKYFPGYPEDMDWSYFLCAPEDQWFEDYFQGNETFEIHCMHPEIEVIEGRLPGLYPRCFLMHTIGGDEPSFGELPLDLDTVWFFPEKLMALMIWRGVTEVADDEAEQITHVLAAYERHDQTARSPEYYRHAFERRRNGDDALLNNLNTEDLIPEGDKCAMELLQEMAYADHSPSEFGRNLDAKAESIQKMADDKIEEAIQEAEKNMASFDIPDEAKSRMGELDADITTAEGTIDIRRLMKKTSAPDPDADVEALNRKMEAILPGITAGDPKKIELKHFSFDKIDQLLAAVDEFTGKKEAEAKEQAKAELTKAKAQIKEHIQTAVESAEEMPAEARAKLEEIENALETIDKMDADSPPPAPLPRIHADEIMAQVSEIDPRVQEALQHFQGMKDMGAGGEEVEQVERQIREMMEPQAQKIETALAEAEKDFKEVYVMGAHFMPDGLPPHQDPLESVAERFLTAIGAGERVADGDWACIDLQGQNLDGVDLSGAFLEQVNFTGASLKGANLRGAIMARAILADADLSGADLAEANIGGVNARRANFSGANLKEAKLSKGDFTEADFSGCELEGVESLEIVVKGALFAEAHIPNMRFIQADLTGARFPGADLNTALFYDCALEDVDFSRAVLTRCTWADVRLINARFDEADMTAACFAATDPEKTTLRNVRFFRSRLDKCCFQGVVMPGAILTEASMENALFNKADLSEADLSFAYARGAQFRKARLTDARLDYINLMEGSLAKADLVNASFIGANLYAVDLLRAIIEDTDFSDSNREATLLD